MTAPAPSPDLSILLDYLKRSRGFDFTGYKPTSLMRRIQKRMQMVNIESFLGYIEYLEVHPAEFAQLFGMILINVTSFFRDQAAWDYVTSDVLPRLLGLKGQNDVIRIWSAGCASGEETYTLTMLMAELLGIEQFHQRVRIYATDVDIDALNRARQAVYSAHDLLNVPDNLKEKYFESGEHQFSFRKDLRRAVIFGRHDLFQDAPISRIDLLVCRNTLMYFNAEAQQRILTRFHFALNPGGYLFLGKAEMLLSHASLFTPLDLRRRVFSKTPKATMRDRLLLLAQTGNEEAASNLSRHMRLREAVFENSSVAQVVIDSTRLLAMANERARMLFGLTVKDIGQVLYDLDFSYRLTEYAYSLRMFLQIDGLQLSNP